MDNIAIRTIGKYALLLSILYVIEYVIVYALEELTNEEEPTIYSLLTFGIYISPFLLNIILAFIVNYDRNKLNIQGKYSVLLTVFYRPIGIVLFLIYVIEQVTRKASTQQKI